MVEPTTIAVINTSPDAVHLMRRVFEQAGFTVVSCFTYDIRDGQLDFEAFIRQHQPRVIVYDLAPPYEANVRLFHHVRSMPAMQSAHFVMTAVNPARVHDLVGREQRVYEVVDRSEDLLRLVHAVKEATRARTIG
jgi:hypothetical protein